MLLVVVYCKGAKEMVLAPTSGRSALADYGSIAASVDDNTKVTRLVMVCWIKVKQNGYL